ncbi:TPA: diphthine--ammonia ligase [Candidatus Micrarchaeota archaeon]|nr:diphthine--ammonia ligase [Candidatus Micrarchaeota archaeon]
MRLAVLFSGGKDSVFAAFWAMQQGFEPVLVTAVPEEYSMMFHHPNVQLAARQAEEMGLEHSFVKVGEDDWHDKLKAELQKLGADGIVTGAIASEYQRWRIEELAEDLGIPAYSPLWHKQDELYHEMLEYLEVYISAVSAEGLGEEWLGRRLNELAENPPKNIHPFLEGGEGETFVADAPFFKSPIRVKEWKKSWDGVRGVAEIVVE